MNTILVGSLFYNFSPPVIISLSCYNLQITQNGQVEVLLCGLHEPQGAMLAMLTTASSLQFSWKGFELYFAP